MAEWAGKNYMKRESLVVLKKREAQVEVRKKKKALFLLVELLVWAEYQKAWLEKRGFFIQSESVRSQFLPTKAFALTVATMREKSAFFLIREELTQK